VECITLISKELADGNTINSMSGALSAQYSLDWNVTMDREDTTVTVFGEARRFTL
jgi:hypothetical protein